MSAPHHTNWRILLGQIITDTASRDRLAARMGVSARSLSRWAFEHHTPTRPLSRLQRLVEALPAYREELIPAIRAEFPDFTMTGLPPARYSIPAEHYRSILEKAALIPDALRFNACARRIAESMIAQLDPDSHGVNITIASCTLPGEGNSYVHSLFVQYQMRTAPWPPYSEETVPHVMGGETLEGYVAMTGVMHYIGDTRDYRGDLPCPQREYVGSICAVPIRRAARIAGVLSVASSQPNYFSIEARRDLVEQYSYLAMVLYSDGQFYAPEQIAVH